MDRETVTEIVDATRTLGLLVKIVVGVAGFLVMLIMVGWTQSRVEIDVMSDRIHKLESWKKQQIVFNERLIETLETMEKTQ